MQVSPSVWAIRPIHWPCGDDRVYVFSNKVMMNFQTSTTSANERTYFITEQENNKLRNYFERTSVQMVEFYFFVFHRLLTYISRCNSSNFQNSPGICEFSADVKG